MTFEEIKLRRITGQHLITPADKLTVVRDLCGIQSQFMVNAMHSLKIRTSDFDEAAAADGLVKNWTIRGTVHVFAESDLPLFIRCNNGKDYRSHDWRGHTFWNQRDKWALTPERQQYFSEIIINSVAESSKTRDELKLLCRENGMTQAEEDSMFDQWGGGIRELCERGFMNYVVQEKKAYCLSPEFVPMYDDKAELEIARRYFTNFAPATVHDAQYFFRTPAAKVRKWLGDLPVQSAECGGKTYFYIENGINYDRDIPKVLFLAGFDQLMLGYEKRKSLFLPAENLRAIFNLAGIVMPSVMLDGRVVGRWNKKNRKISVELFETLYAHDISAIKEKIAELWNDISTVDIVN